MIIREAQDQDIGELTHLGRHLLDLHGNYDPYYYTLEENFPSLFSDWLKNQLYTSHQAIFVAQDNILFPSSNKIIGFISGFIKSLYPWFKVKSVGHISYLVIDPQYRMQHIGKALEQKLTSWFQSKGVEYIEVYTDEKNGIGVSAWVSYGYLPFKKYLRKKI